MEESTLTALSQRPEAFWVGVALLLGGSLAAEAAADASLAGHLAALGALIITTRLLVGVFRILHATYEAWRYGYEEGRLNA